ncbi:unnamed protein product, partial [Ectocarpus sp. 8 AP-2014]
MNQPRETTERKGGGYSWAEDDDHARVLLALHLELLAYGLNVHGGDSPAVRMEQSSAGAFPPMRYVDGGGGCRVITIHALAMFDDLIVSGTAVATGGRDGGKDSSGDAVHRRTTFSVSEWSPQLLLSSTSRDQQQQSGGAAKGQPQQEQLKEGQQNEEESPSGGARSGEQCPTATKHPHLPERQVPPPGDGDNDGGETDKGTGESTSLQQQQRRQRRPSLAGGKQEAFRSRVVSGLLLHLCPPPGHFADLLGCGDELLRHVLGMLGARDLATVGLTGRAAAVSVAADCLWAELVAADFSEREQHAVLFLQPPPPRSPSRSPSLDAAENATAAAAASEGDCRCGGDAGCGGESPAAAGGLAAEA